MIPTTSMAEYRELSRVRESIIAENRARRMRSKGPREPLPVPPKPARPLVPIAYAPDGTYAGRLTSAADAPPGHTVRWELAAW